MRISNSDFYKITGCSDDTYALKFNIQEMQQFLIDIGYEIFIYKGTANVYETSSDGDGKVEVVGKHDEERERILAMIKKDKAKLISENLKADSKEVMMHDFRRVFEREFKSRLFDNLSR